MDDAPSQPKPKRKLPKLDPARIRFVDQLLRSCMTHGRICTILATEWDITERQARKYIAATLRQWDRDSEVMAGGRTELRRAQLEGVLERCLLTVDPDHILKIDPKTGETVYFPKPDLRTAVLALDRLCRIEGIFTPTAVNVTHTMRKASTMRSSDREGELLKLLTKYRDAKRAREEKALKSPQ